MRPILSSIESNDETVTSRILESLKLQIEVVGNGNTSVMEDVAMTLSSSMHTVPRSCYDTFVQVIMQCVIASAPLAEKVLLVILKDMRGNSHNELVVKIIASCPGIDPKILEKAEKVLIECLTCDITEKQSPNEVNLSALVVCVDIISESNRSFVYDALRTYITENNTEENLKSVVDVFAAKYPEEVMKEIVNPLLSFEKLSQGEFMRIFTILSDSKPNRIQRLILEFLFNGISANFNRACDIIEVVDDDYESFTYDRCSSASFAIATLPPSAKRQLSGGGSTSGPEKRLNTGDTCTEDNCVFTCETNNQFKTHMRFHTHELSCPDCPKRYQTKKDLLIHMLSYHGKLVEITVDEIKKSYEFKIEEGDLKYEEVKKQ